MGYVIAYAFERAHKLDGNHHAVDHFRDVVDVVADYDR